MRHVQYFEHLAHRGPSHARVPSKVLRWLPEHIFSEKGRNTVHTLFRGLMRTCWLTDFMQLSKGSHSEMIINYIFLLCVAHSFRHNQFHAPVTHTNFIKTTDVLVSLKMRKCLKPFCGCATSIYLHLKWLPTSN